MKTLSLAVAATLISFPSVAQDNSAAPMVIEQRTEGAVVVLPANTEVLVSMNDTITTKGKKYSEGDTFAMSVVHDVMLGDYVVIPKGSRATGRISWLTSKGAFGKSGKMEIDIEYVEVGGRRIPLTGNYRQEGEGNTVGTVAGVLVAGVFAGFVTGKSGVIPSGRELMARTKDDLPVKFAGAVPQARSVMEVTTKAGASFDAIQSTPPAQTSNSQVVQTSQGEVALATKPK